ETLQDRVRQTKENPFKYPLNMEDMDTGIESIKKRSEGLMMFAKTYRSLNKVTNLNLGTVLVRQMFDNIGNLIYPSMEKKKIILYFVLVNTKLLINLDTYQIVQVQINLILNTVKACKSREGLKIIVPTNKKSKG